MLRLLWTLDMRLIHAILVLVNAHEIEAVLLMYFFKA